MAHTAYSLAPAVENFTWRGEPCAVAYEPSRREFVVRWRGRAAVITCLEMADLCARRDFGGTYAGREVVAKLSAAFDGDLRVAAVMPSNEPTRRAICLSGEIG